MSKIKELEVELKASRWKIGDLSGQILPWRGLVCCALNRDSTVFNTETLDYEELRDEVLALHVRLYGATQKI